MMIQSFMKCFFLIVICSYQISAQPWIQQQVIATCGASQTSSMGSISFTLGEANTRTLSAANLLLTQGFQQPFEINLFHIRAYLQGYYIGAGQMADVFYQQGVYVNPSLETDTLQVELRESTAPHQLIFQQSAILKQDGSLTVQGMGILGQSYYLVVKHRNHIETWSEHPIMISSVTNYDFSEAVDKAFGSNQLELEPGIFAFYTGDMNQDGVVDGLDYNDWENDSNDFAGGYLSTDLNGDGIVDGLDFIYWEQNSNNFVGAVVP